MAAGAAVALGGAVVLHGERGRGGSSIVGGASVLGGASTLGGASILGGSSVLGGASARPAIEVADVLAKAEGVEVSFERAGQAAVSQPRIVMGLGMCMQSRGVRGTVLEGPMQDTPRDWIPYPQDTVHWDTKEKPSHRSTWKAPQRKIQNTFSSVVTVISLD